MNQGVPPIADGGSGPGLDMDMPPRQNQPPVSSNLGGMMSAGVGPGIKSGRPGLDENIPGPQGLNTNAPGKDSAIKPPFSSVPSSTAPDAAASATYINFDNPSVQKALDNLMQSGPNLLKNISLSASGVTNTSSNQSSIPSLGDTSGMNVQNDPLHQRGNIGSRGPPDMGGNLPPRGAGNLDMGPRGGHNMGDIGGPGVPRNSGNMQGMGGMGPNRGGYGSNIPDMGHMNNPRGFGGSGAPDMGRMGPPRGGMGPPQGQDIGGMGPPQGMGQGGFPNQNQFNKFQGPGQQGNFPPGPYNSGMGPGMGGMSRQPYGGMGMGMGMGGAPRRPY